MSGTYLPIGTTSIHVSCREREREREKQIDDSSSHEGTTGSGMVPHS